MASGRTSITIVAVIILASLLTAAAFFLLRPAARSPDQVMSERHLARAYFEERRYDRARSILSDLVEESEAVRDLLNLAAVELAAADGDLARVRELLDRAEQAASPDVEDRAAAAFLQGVLARREVRLDDARVRFARALELAPADLPTRLILAVTLEDLGRRDEAIALYQEVVDGGIELGASWHLTAMFRLGSALRRSEDETERERGLELLRGHRELVDSGIPTAAMEELEVGSLGRVRVPPNVASVPSAAASATDLSFETMQTGIVAEAGVARAVEARFVDGDGREDLVVVGRRGVYLALQRVEADFDTRLLDGGSWRRCVAADIDNSGIASFLLLADASGVKLLVPGPGGWEDQTARLPGAAARPIADATFVDFDHDGDLDLVLATPGGLALVRNDGRRLPPAEGAPRGPMVFTELSAPDTFRVPFTWIAFEDFDADNDIDFLAGGGGGETTLILNLRRSRFDARPPARTRLPGLLDAEPLLADLDHDGFVDLLAIAPAPAWQRNQGDGTFAAPVRLPWLEGALGPGAAIVVDLDLDGELDLVGPGPDGRLRGRLGSLLAGGGATIELGAAAVPASPPAVVDLDHDGDHDVVGPAAGGGIEVRRGHRPTPASTLRVTLQGRKDNRSAVGAIVEVRSGTLYQRRLATGGALLFGLGEARRADIVRVTWPNGVTQHAMEAAAESLEMTQSEGLVGSCPFLYAWSSGRYEFVTDVLGGTPLGLPTARGGYVPPDHDEFVRLEASQLNPADGEFRLYLTEELREVTYLDHAELWVVDHAASVQVHPEERFTFPPFPPRHIHTVRRTLPLVRAIGSDGRDWTRELREKDGRHAAPFTPLEPQFQGLATPHHLDLVLPPEVAAASKVRLVMTGWFFWSEASVGVATAQHPDHDFIPPTLLVPDGKGDWKSTGPPVGFPAGKTKTMVLDISERLERTDLRLRIFSSLRLYWDQILVAVDEDDAPIEIRRIPASVARLHHRGFSRRLPGIVPGAPAHDQPERFDFQTLERHPRWDQHAGLLTRHGDVLPLLERVDDCFVIFSAGDALDLRFPARTSAGELPQVAEGQKRTFLLYLDGWAKDGDFNTTLAETVEPLPFHAMSGYPYGPSESYPDDSVHRRYREEWNTRPGRKLREALSPTGSAPARGEVAQRTAAPGPRYSAATKRRLLASLPKPMFTEVASELGLKFLHAPDPELQRLRARLEIPVGQAGGGVAANDFDGDGDPDLFFCGGGGGRLFRNEKGERFTDVTEAVGLRLRGESRAAYFVDYDGDGDLDLSITFAWSEDRLFENDGTGHFADVTAEVGLGRHRDVTHGAIWFDMNGDGLLDVYTATFGPWPGGAAPTVGQQNFNGGPNRLYRQKRDGDRRVFEDIAAAAGGDDRGWTHCVGAWDFDLDGHVDLFSLNDFARSHVYRSRGDDTFAEWSLELGMKETYNAMSFSLVDLDGDGRSEAYISELSSSQNMIVIHEQGRPKRLREPERVEGIVDDEMLGRLARTVNNRLYAMEGRTLEDRHARLFEPTEMGWAWDASALDYENDGDLDFLVLNGTEDRPPRLPDERRKLFVGHAAFLRVYAREKNDFFVSEEGYLYNVYDACELAYAGNSRGSAFLDFDGDGDLDVAINDFLAPARLFRNEQTTGNAWVRVELRGTRSNRSALGARVTVRDSTGRTQSAIVVAGSGFLSQNPLPLHFGLGKAEQIVSLTIYWPSGLRQELRDLEPGRVHSIVEPRE